jgi:hypothetical protein
MLSRLIVLSYSSSVVASVISVCGALFLMIIGIFFQAGVEELVKGKEELLKEPQEIAKACFLAAFIYVLIFGFAFVQMLFNLKVSAGNGRYPSI